MKPGAKVDIGGYNKYKDKSCMFFSASNRKDWTHLTDIGIYQVLVSYFYFRKDRGFDEWLKELHGKDGLFMTDSGGFSFISGEIKDEYYKEEFWKPYLEEYLQWLHDHKGFIYVAANLDLDAYLGRDVIDRWNEDYFKPLEKDMQIVYVAHRDWERQYADFNGLKRVKQYMKLHDYVGVNQNYKDYSSQIYSLAKINKTRLHGFAWTSYKMLHKQPFFSCDSTTWLSGVRYGTTYTTDGRNFRTLDKKGKIKRQHHKYKCKVNGVDQELLLAEDRYMVNKYNLIAWIQARNNYIKIANSKLWNKPMTEYAKAGI